jgi:hypothetical protein
MTVTLRIPERAAAAVVSLGLVLLGACHDNPAKPIEGAGDPENISRVTVALTPVGGGTATQSVVVDPDGTQLPQPPGAPQGTLALSKGKTYNGTISLLNDLDSKNVIDISNEVKKEANFHRFFYTFTGTCQTATTANNLSVPVSGMDVDTQSPAQPVGLTFQLVVPSTAATSSSCTMHVELHHFETAKGDGTGSTFDTDLSLDFPATIS